MARKPREKAFIFRRWFHLLLTLFVNRLPRPKCPDILRKEVSYEFMEKVVISWSLLTLLLAFIFEYIWG
jgi:hypothetical protein